MIEESFKKIITANNFNKRSISELKNDSKLNEVNYFKIIRVLILRILWKHLLKVWQHLLKRVFMPTNWRNTLILQGHLLQNMQCNFNFNKNDLLIILLISFLKNKIGVYFNKFIIFHLLIFFSYLFYVSEFLISFKFPYLS